MRRKLTVLAVLALAASLAACFHLQPVSDEEFSHQPQPTLPQNGVTPLELTAYPTLNCIGIQWFVDGDANANATATVEYREAGSEQWIPALPLHRAPSRPNQQVKFLKGLEHWVPEFRAYAVEHFRQNYLAGSIFNLDRATTYEIRVTLSDPESGTTTRTITASTRTVPTIDYKRVRFIQVKGGPDAISLAVKDARPGDILQVRPGTYSGDIVIANSGNPDNPITLAATTEGPVLIDGGDNPANNDKTNGITVTGANVQITGLAFRNFHTCIKAQPSAKNLIITRCKMNHFYNGITTDADDGYIADNSLRESYHALDMSIPGNKRKSCHGIEAGIASRGNVICYNEISLVADALHAYGANTDVLNNDVIFGVDDAIELDFGNPNIRLIDNRFSFTGENGISFQPYIGGPAYCIRNCVFGMKENPLKNRYDSDGVYFFNNTFISRDGNGNDLPFGSVTRNNIFLTSPGKGPRSARIDLDPNHQKPDMDFDAFGPIGPNGKPVADFAKETGLEKHGIQISDNAQVLANPPVIPPEYIGEHWTAPKPYLESTTRPHPDYTLAKDSPAIGAGTPIPTITPPEIQHPDLGALPHDQPAPHYGPR